MNLCQLRAALFKLKSIFFRLFFLRNCILIIIYCKNYSLLFSMHIISMFCFIDIIRGIISRAVLCSRITHGSHGSLLFTA